MTLLGMTPAEGMQKSIQEGASPLSMEGTVGQRMSASLERSSNILSQTPRELFKIFREYGGKLENFVLIAGTLNTMASHNFLSMREIGGRYEPRIQSVPKYIKIPDSDLPVENPEYTRLFQMVVATMNIIHDTDASLVGFGHLDRLRDEMNERIAEASTQS